MLVFLTFIQFVNVGFHCVARLPGTVWYYYYTTRTYVCSRNL